MASLRELRLQVLLANRQAKVDKTLVGLPTNDDGETLNPHNEKYLLENEDEIKQDIEMDTIPDEVINEARARIEEEVKSDLNTVVPPIVKRKIQDFINANPYITAFIAPNNKFYYPVDINQFKPDILEKNTINMSRARDSKTETYQKRQELYKIYIQERDNIIAYNEVMKEKIDKLEKDLFNEEKEKLRQNRLAILMNEIINQRKAFNLKSKPSERLPAESDEDYARRLEEININMPDVKTIIIQQKEKKKRELIRHLEMLMKPADAYNVANSPTFMGEAGENNVILINRTWTKFEKELRKTYDKLDIPTFLAFVDTYLYKIALNPAEINFDHVKSKMENKQEKIPDNDNINFFTPNKIENYLDSATEAEARVLTDKESIKRGDEKANQMIKDIHELLDTLYNEDPFKLIDIGKELTQKYNVPESVYYKSTNGLVTKYIKDYQGFKAGDPKPKNNDDIIASYKKVFEKLIKEGEYQRGDIGQLGLGKKKIIKFPKANLQRKKVVKKVIYGGGLSARSKGVAIEKTYPVYIPFGKLLIEEAPLVKDNYLTVRSALSGVIQDKIKESKISDDFNDIIMDIQEKRYLMIEYLNVLVMTKRI